MDLDREKHWCERLYEAKAAGLILYGRSLGLSHAEAEDVLQETFRALLELDHQPEQSDRYLLRAFRNRALNHRRGLLRRLRREAESKSWFEPQDNAAEDRKPEIMHRLARLPRKQGEVIVLRIWHQHSFETIGTLLGISPNTAAARYRYGLQKLRTALPNQEEYEHERTRTGTDRSTIEPVDTKESVSTAFRTGLPLPAGG